MPVLAAELALPDAAAVTELALRCQRLRADAGLAVSRWAPRCVLAAVQTALQRGHPTDRVVAALLAVAADPVTRSPMRLAEAGPWWARPPRQPCGAPRRRTRSSPSSRATSPTATTAPGSKPKPAPSSPPNTDLSTASVSPAAPGASPTARVRQGPRPSGATAARRVL